MNNIKYKKSIEFITLILIMCFFSIVFLAFGGGHRCLTSYINSDLQFHLNRTIGLFDVLKHPINYQTFNQIGIGINYFYPWLTIYPAIILIKLSHSVVNGLLIFIFLMNVISGMIAYYALKPLYKNQFKSIVFSIMFIFVTYRTLNVYRRFDIGECLAMTFMLIVFSSMYQIIIEGKSRWLSLAMGMTLILYSHLLSTIIASLMCLLMVIIAWKKMKKLKFVFLQLCKSAIATFFLGLGFLIPYLQQTIAGINPPFKGNLPDAALAPSDLFNNSLNNTLGNNQTTLISLGVFCLAFLLIGMIKQNKTTLEKIFFNLGLISVFLSTKLFPWGMFQKYCSLLQFPWRFIETASIFLLIYGVSMIVDLNKKAFALGMIGCSIIIFGSSVSNLESTTPSQSIVTSKNIKKIKSYDNWDYFPKQAAYNTSIVTHKFYNEKGKQVPVTWMGNNSNYQIKLNSYKFKTLNTPVLYYYGLRVKINGKKVTFKESNRGTVEIYDVPSKGIIEITSGYTRLARLGQLISVLALGIVIAFDIKRHFKRKAICN